MGGGKSCKPDNNTTGMRGYLRCYGGIQTAWSGIFASAIGVFCEIES